MKRQRMSEAVWQRNQPILDAGLWILDFCGIFWVLFYPASSIQQPASRSLVSLRRSFARDCLTIAPETDVLDIIRAWIFKRLQLHKIHCWETKEMLNTKSLREQVYEYLRDEINNRKLLPGTTINLNEISQQLGISKTPLRDAIIQLEIEGFVTILPRRGVTVKKINAPGSKGFIWDCRGTWGNGYSECFRQDR